MGSSVLGVVVLGCRWTLGFWGWVMDGCWASRDGCVGFWVDVEVVGVVLGYGWMLGLEGWLCCLMDGC